MRSNQSEISLSQESDQQIFTRNVTQLRKKHNLSKNEMAKLLGISVWSLNKIESGELPPRLTVEVVYRIYDHFGLSPSQQFTPPE